MSLKKMAQKKGFFGKDKWTLLLMASPCLLLLILFQYVPLFGWVYGFFNYKPGYPVFQSEFVGFKYFILAFGDSTILMVLRNTLVLGFIGIGVTVVPPIFAIFLTELRGKAAKAIIQTVTSFPYFIGWILVYSVAFIFLSVDDGLVNKILLSLGIIKEPLNLLAEVKAVWPLQTFIGIWKSVGFQAIIYLAAISGIDIELYDAASIDGASRFRKILHVTVPSLLTTYFTLLLIGVGFILSSGFEQYYLFRNPLVYSRIQVLDVYLYDIGLTMNQYSLSTVLGMSKTVVSLVLLFLANGLSKLTRDVSIL